MRIVLGLIAFALGVLSFWANAWLDFLPVSVLAPPSWDIGDGQFATVLSAPLALLATLLIMNMRVGLARCTALLLQAVFALAVTACMFIPTTFLQFADPTQTETVEEWWRLAYLTMNIAMVLCVSGTFIWLAKAATKSKNGRKTATDHREKHVA